jgi:site-specific DNA recombinase
MSYPLVTARRPSNTYHPPTLSGDNASLASVSAEATVSDRPRLRAGLYQRVSNDPRGDSVSPEQQEKENRAWAATQGNIDIVWSITDQGFSASRHRKKERPGYAQAAENIAGAAPIDILITWAASRYQRDLEVHVELRKLCTAGERNTLLAYKGRIYDFERPDDRFATALDAIIAERESDEIRANVLRAIRANVAAGKPHGRLAYGYRSVYDSGTGRVVDRVPDAQTAPVVVEIVRRVGAGDAGYAIAGDLNSRAVPSPHEHRSSRLGREVVDPYPWTLEQVHRIAKNPTYAALRVHKGKVVGDATWEPIVTLAEHSRAVGRLSAPGRDNRRNPSDSTAKHLLSGIALCGVCGSPCRMLPNRGYPSYVCWGGPAKRGTGCVSRVQLPVDVLVAETIIEWAQRPDIAAKLAAQHDDDGATLAAAEVVDIQQQLDDLADAVIGQRMTPALAGRIEAGLLPQLEEARARSIPRSVPVEVRNLVGPHARRRWENDIDVAEQRRIVRALVEVTILKSPYKNGVRGFDPDLVTVRWFEPY